MIARENSRKSGDQTSVQQFQPVSRGGRIGLVISDIWAKTPNDDDILAKNLLISDN